MNYSYIQHDTHQTENIFRNVTEKVELQHAEKSVAKIV